MALAIVLTFVSSCLVSPCPIALEAKHISVLFCHFQAERCVHKVLKLNSCHSDQCFLFDYLECEYVIFNEFGQKVMTNLDER